MNIPDERLDAPIFEVATSSRWIAHGLRPELHTRLYNAIRHHQQVPPQRRLELQKVRDLVYTPDAVLLRRVRSLGAKTLREWRNFQSKEDLTED